MSTITQGFATFGLNYHLTQSDAAHAKRALLDWWGAALAGANTKPATLLEGAFAACLDQGSASLLLGRAALPTTAALINGTASHTVEMDDIFKDAIYHPGAATIPAALAAAQDIGADGHDLLKAIVVGYEISTRIGAALGRAHYRYWHNTGTVGSFGAAAAAASLYGLNEGQFAHALATVATFAAGLQQAFRMDSMSKPLHAGRAAEAGLQAALMARQGVTGALDVLEGEVGLGLAMGEIAGGQVNWEAALSDLGKQANIARMTFKNHACCGHTFSAIDGAQTLAKQMNLLAQDFMNGRVQAIEVATYGPALEVAGNPNPQSAAQAKFSVQFVVASALLYGSVRLNAFDEQRLQDPAIRALMTRIKLVKSPALDALFPKQRSAQIDFQLADGHSQSYLQAHRKGDPELPMSDSDLSDKFFDLCTPVVGEVRAKELADLLWRAESVTDLKQLCAKPAN